MNTQLNRTIWKLAGLAMLLVMLVVLASAAPTATSAAPRAPGITETFRNATAPGWVLSGSASLTSGGVDPAGAGWLRLTPASEDQAGSAIYNTAFNATDGTQVTFTYAAWGGSGADGIVFYLIDGTVAVPTVGASGGSLGYAWNKRVNPDANGVTGGYIGVGLDEWGNFANTFDVEANPYGTGGFAAGQTPGVTVRGPGNLLDAGSFPYLTRANATIPATRAATKRVRITITPTPGPTLTVAMDSGAGFVTLINAFALTATPPATFKMGFSSSTGGSTNNHEIRDLSVTGARPSTTTPVCVPNPSWVGQSVTCTATVTGAAGTPTGTIDFYDGSTLLASGVALNGSAQATYTTSAFALGAHTINANYGGDSVYGASSGSTTQQVNKIPTTTTVTSSANPSTVGQCVTFTATVAGSAGTTASAKVNAPKQTGTVTFRTGSTIHCSNVVVTGGVATCRVCNLAVSLHTITADYSGDATYLASNGTLAGGQRVNDLPPSEVPEADTLLLMGGGLGGAGVWLRYQWTRLKKAKSK